VSTIKRRLLACQTHHNLLDVSFIFLFVNILILKKIKIARALINGAVRQHWATPSSFRASETQLYRQNRVPSTFARTYPLRRLLGSLESAFLVSTIKRRLLAFQTHHKVVLEHQKPNCFVKTGFQAHLQGGTHFGVQQKAVDAVWWPDSMSSAANP
jgi:hypothetical protein